MNLSMLGRVMAVVAAVIAIVVSQTHGVQEASYVLLWAIWLHVVANSPKED